MKRTTPSDRYMKAQLDWQMYTEALRRKFRRQGMSKAEANEQAKKVAAEQADIKRQELEQRRLRIIEARKEERLEREQRDKAEGT